MAKDEDSHGDDYDHDDDHDNDHDDYHDGVISLVLFNLKCVSMCASAYFRMNIDPICVRQGVF